MFTDTDFLQMAVDESLVSIKEGSSPFGAVIVKDGTVIARAHNRVVPDHDATAHAEMCCIRKACQQLGTFDLSGCILYSSCEPCPMCLNAIKWANIKKVYFAASRYDADDIGFRDNEFYQNLSMDMHHIELKSARQVMDQWYRSDNKKEY